MQLELLVRLSGENNTLNQHMTLVKTVFDKKKNNRNEIMFEKKHDIF
jgi:hypothetical protein